MPRLFIFAIGGTGSRVLKSLTMLLASGIKPATKNEFEIVPIIIDPHKSNEDLKRTVRLLDNYQTIANEIGSDNGFFSNRICTLDKLVSSKNRLASSFTFNLQQVANTKFKDYIDLNQMEAPTKALTDLLFSGKSIDKRGGEVDLLDIEMDIGFVGNPNVGSVVLNQLKDSEEFKEFASNFNDDDRVFIISSIFGGTGAAGFPTILKNIRDARNNNNIDGKGFLENAKVGAVTVLPYFNIEKDVQSPIQKSAFIAKSKSALNYYTNSVNGAINALYYVSDDFNGKPYKNDPGDGGQKNDAHFIELVAALSIIDFMEIPDRELQSNEGKPNNPIFKQFGMRQESGEVKFSDFEDFTERKIGLHLSQLTIFRKYLLEHLNDSIEKQAWSNDTPEINKKFLDDSFYRVYLKEFMDAYGEWLQEMGQNRRAFVPFNLSASLPALIVDKEIKTKLFSSKVDYAFYDDKLNKQSKGKAFSSAPIKFIKLFHDATQDILTSKYGLKN